MRRSRRTHALRRLVAETTLSSADFIYPVLRARALTACWSS
jgi:delta-aminolevulinic acid dehydratase/porphobilinogen synthase